MEPWCVNWKSVIAVGATPLKPKISRGFKQGNDGGWSSKRRKVYTVKDPSVDDLLTPDYSDDGQAPYGDIGEDAEELDTK